jgi:hypothetical protein
MSDRYESLSDFYPYYLGEHRNGVCRSLHVLGCLSVLTFLFAGLLTEHRQLLWFVPVVGYGPAWVGHYFFEKNRPATFQYPLYSLVSDWIMFKDILTFKVPLFGTLPEKV